jgi:hypothetical protein
MAASAMKNALGISPASADKSCIAGCGGSNHDRQAIHAKRHRGVPIVLLRFKHER